MDLPGRDFIDAYRQRLLRALLEPGEVPESGQEPERAGGSAVPVSADAAEVSDRAECAVVGHARSAAALGVLPVVDLIAVTTLQARMLRRLAELRGVHWDGELARDFIARLGPGIAGGILGHTVGRSVLKILPVVGQSAGAAWSARSSAISTYAIGKAADYFLSLHAVGRQPAASDLRQVHARAAGTAAADVKRLIGREAG